MESDGALTLVLGPVEVNKLVSEIPILFNRLEVILANFEVRRVVPVRYGHLFFIDFAKGIVAPHFEELFLLVRCPVVDRRVWLVS